MISYDANVANKYRRIIATSLALSKLQKAVTHSSEKKEHHLYTNICFIKKHNKIHFNDKSRPRPLLESDSAVYSL